LKSRFKPEGIPAGDGIRAVQAAGFAPLQRTSSAPQFEKIDSVRYATINPAGRSGLPLPADSGNICVDARSSRTSVEQHQVL